MTIETRIKALKIKRDPDVMQNIHYMQGNNDALEEMLSVLADIKKGNNE